MNPYRFAAQLYSVRRECTTPRKTYEVLKRIAAMGYVAVEVAGICPIETEELSEMLADAGLLICAIHGRPDEILNDPHQLIDRALQLKCPYVCYPIAKGFDLSLDQDVLRLRDALTLAGGCFQKEGLTLCYHHHSLEFARHGKGTVLEYLLDHTNPGELCFELDTYWVQHGGGDPSKWCRLAKGRLPLLHLKDYGCIQGVPTYMEIGNGNLEWPPILRAARESGCDWYIVEQDETPGDPLESLRVSHDNLSSIVAAMTGRPSPHNS